MKSKRTRAKLRQAMRETVKAILEFKKEARDEGSKK
jgi:Sec-independent protein translocase protein TatA